MAISIDPHADPNARAICPRRLLGDPSAPRCRALVLVKDAAEHERWHDHLDELLSTAPVTAEAEPVDWPVLEGPDVEAAPIGPYS
jgi:hypothetical protein